MDGILGTQIVLAAFAAALALLAMADGAWASHARRRPAFGASWQAAPDAEELHSALPEAGAVVFAWRRDLTATGADASTGNTGSIASPA